MSKFNLFSRAALSSMAVAMTGGIAPGAAAPDPDAGPEKTDDPSDKPADPVDPAAPSDKPADPPADDPAPDAADQVVTVADATAVATEQHAAGFAAANARMAAVFAAPEAVANASMAAWMLSNSPGASAESIIGQLKSMPGAAMQTAAIGSVVEIPDTNLDLGRGNPASALDPEANAEDPWAASSARVFGTAADGNVTIRSDAGLSYQPVVTGGSTPSNVAGVRPTGN